MCAGTGAEDDRLDRWQRRSPEADRLPALDGVVERLERGARVADVGCGHGASTILMATAFPIDSA
jgi:trans-aconitate methyltransferase